jgi:hypothetical protein
MFCFYTVSIYHRMVFLNSFVYIFFVDYFTYFRFEVVAYNLIFKVKGFFTNFVLLLNDIAF